MKSACLNVLFLLIIMLTVVKGKGAPFTGLGANAVPLPVKAAFERKFPAAENVHWGKENATEWEADFRWKSGKFSANFLADGTWVETEEKIPIADFPKAVARAIGSQFPGWKITEADRTDTAKHGVIYEADLRKGAKKKEVAFKEDGSVMIE